MLKRTKVLAIADMYPPQEGDIAQGVQRVVGKLNPFLQSVEVLTFDPELALGTVTTDMEDGVSIYRLGISRKTSLALETIGDFINLLHKKNNYHLFHLFNLLYAGYLGTFYGRYHGIPTVLTLRRDELERAMVEPNRFALSQWAIDHGAAITCASQDLVKKVQALGGKEESLWLIPDSVDPRKYTAKKVLNLARLPEGTLLACMGELRLKYGLKILLHAFQIVARQWPATRLVLMGDLEEEDERVYTHFLSHSGLRDRIHLLPFPEKERIPDYLANFEMVIFPALRGDVPTMALKAMACTATLVCSEIGGFQELIRHGHNGYLCPPGNPRALSKLIMDILTKKDDSVGKRARATIIRNHLPQREREEFLKVYQRLLTDTEIF